MSPDIREITLSIGGTVDPWLLEITVDPWNMLEITCGPLKYLEITIGNCGYGRLEITWNMGDYHRYVDPWIIGDYCGPLKYGPCRDYCGEQVEADVMLHQKTGQAHRKCGGWHPSNCHLCAAQDCFVRRPSAKLLWPLTWLHLAELSAAE